MELVLDVQAPIKSWVCCEQVPVNLKPTITDGLRCPANLLMCPDRKLATINSVLAGTSRISPDALDSRCPSLFPRDEFKASDHLNCVSMAADGDTAEQETASASRLNPLL